MRSPIETLTPSGFARVPEEDLAARGLTWS
jgi:hypothetical protein